MTDIFCKLPDVWREQGKILFENQNTYSILSVTPATPGHFIVVPKRHVEMGIELFGDELVDLERTIIGALNKVIRIYETNPHQIDNFYEQLLENPPTPASFASAQRMLAHRHLHVKPDYSWNTGTNNGGYAGQMVDHYHIQVFPRRFKGLGVVSAMEKLLE